MSTLIPTTQTTMPTSEMQAALTVKKSIRPSKHLKIAMTAVCYWNFEGSEPVPLAHSCYLWAVKGATVRGHLQFV